MSIVKLKIPPKVTIEINSLSLGVKGPKGTKFITKHISFNCSCAESNTLLVCLSNQKNKINKSTSLNKQFNTFITQLQNAIKGVFKGYFTELKLTGVGYRFLSCKDNVLRFKAGFCNDLAYKIPSSIDIFIENPTSILLYSYDYDLLKQVSAKLKHFKKPDAYKGKGFRFSNEILSLKEVKKN